MLARLPSHPPCHCDRGLDVSRRTGSRLASLCAEEIGKDALNVVQMALLDLAADLWRLPSRPAAGSDRTDPLFEETGRIAAQEQRRRPRQACRAGFGRGCLRPAFGEPVRPVRPAWGSAQARLALPAWVSGRALLR